MEFDCMEFLKEEIRHDNAAVRIGAINRLYLVASALGPKRTLDELVPYLTKAIQEHPLCNDDEFLYNVATQCKVLSDRVYIEGNLNVLVAPLEFLAAQDETLIREQAIESLCDIVKKHPAMVPEHLVPVLHRLAEASEFFTARLSACGLLPIVYGSASEEQKASLRDVYSSLCADDTPMVRRAAAARMGDLVSVCDKQIVVNDILPVYRQLSQEDSQDDTRVSCVRAAWVIGGKFTKEENTAHTVGFVQRALQDRSWRVRLTVAKNFDKFCTALGMDLIAQHVMADFAKLLQDSEHEVRREALRVIEPCLELDRPLTSEQLQEHIMPNLTALGLDPSPPVRATLAQVLGPVAKALGRDVTERQLLGQIADLMKDEFHEVRLNMAGHSALICEVLGADGMVHSLLATIQDLLMDSNWRIRQRLVEQMPKLAKLFGVELFQSKLETLYLSTLRDSVQSVREAPVHTAKELSDVFGSQWTVEHLLPKLLELYSQSTSYAFRVTTLQVLPQVTGVMTPEQVMSFIMPVVIKATKDTVANVRFCACRVISSLATHHDFGQVAINTVIKPALLELEHDTDIDVQYFAHFARRAIEAC